MTDIQSVVVVLVFDDPHAKQAATVLSSAAAVGRPLLEPRPPFAVLRVAPGVLDLAGGGAGTATCRPRASTGRSPTSQLTRSG